jgi:putative phosphoesterase
LDVIVGILADTHGRHEAAKAAVAILRERGAEFLIHCGDVGSPLVLDQLAGLRSAFVFGNNDWNHRAMQQYASDLGIQCLGAVGELEMDGKKFVVLHGDNTRLLQELIALQKHDYLLFGHTHVQAQRREGRMRLINPGALHRAAVKTVAMLDTRADAVEFYEVTVA